MSMHNPAHPGEILADLVLEPLGLSIAETARHLGVARGTLSRIVNGRAPITPEMAMRLEAMFRRPDAAHWLRLQAAYDIWQMQNEYEFAIEPFEPGEHHLKTA